MNPDFNPGPHIFVLDQSTSAAESPVSADEFFVKINNDNAIKETKTISLFE